MDELIFVFWFLSEYWWVFAIFFIAIEISDRYWELKRKNKSRK